MLKTLLAGTALASLLALGAQAQQAPETTPPVATENQLPSATSDEEAVPIVPQAADSSDTVAPDTMAPDSMAAEPAEAPTGGPMIEEGWAPVDLATISTDTLIGNDIRTYDQETVAAVEDVLIAPDGQVESIVARFGGFLGFGETTVLLGLEEISVVKDADDNVMVLTSLTPEALKERPEYTPPEG